MWFQKCLFQLVYLCIYAVLNIEDIRNEGQPKFRSGRR